MGTRVWRASIVVGVLLLPAVSRGEGAPGPDLVLLWSDPGRALSPRSVHLLEHEVTRQLRAWGVRVLWRADVTDAPDVGRPVARLVAIDRNRLGILGPPVLGTASRAGEGASTAWILLPNVTRLLEGERAARAFTTPEFARAVARVALHELVHLLAPHLDHARSGLMRASLSSADLVRPFIPLDERSRRALLAGILARGPGTADARGL